jgi:hypothetical protein
VALAGLIVTMSSSISLPADTQANRVLDAKDGFSFAVPSK